MYTTSLLVPEIRANNNLFGTTLLNPKYALENLLHIKTTSKQGIASLFYRIFNAHYEVLRHNLD